MLNDDNGIKRIAKDNVITTDESCEILGRTRQQLNNYVRNGDIEIFKPTKNGNLFWRPDVYRLAHMIHKKRVREHHEILGGTTGQAYEAIEKLKLNPNEISEIYVFFLHNDAIQRDFYNLCAVEMPDTLIEVEAPRFVVIMNDGTEHWLEGFTCGYGGVGPSGTEDTLVRWGIIDKRGDDGVDGRIWNSSILHIVREENEWNFITEESCYRYVENRLEGNHWDEIGVSFYYFNQKLVLTQENLYRSIMDRKRAIPTELLLKYIDFIPQPSTVQFLSYDTAIETGHFSVSFSKTIAYQIIIKDVMDRELWIQYPFEEIPNEKQHNMKELLEMLGMEVEDASFIEKAKQWFSAKPRWINKTYSRR